MTGNYIFIVIQWITVHFYDGEGE